MRISVEEAVNNGRIAEFCRRWGIEELAVFGSMARGDYTAESDVDLLYKGGSDLAAMEDELRAIFGRKVDLVFDGPIKNPYRRHNITLDRRLIYPVVELRIDRIRDTPRFERELSLVWDITDAGRELVQAIRAKTFDDYVDEQWLRLGCERLLITIGEAVRGLSGGFRDRYPDIPWTSIVDHRNVLVHNYAGIDHERVWKILTVDIPELLKAIERELPR